MSIRMDSYYNNISGLDIQMGCIIYTTSDPETRHFVSNGKDNDPNAYFILKRHCPNHKKEGYGPHHRGKCEFCCQAELDGFEYLYYASGGYGFWYEKKIATMPINNENRLLVEIFARGWVEGLLELPVVY